MNIYKIQPCLKTWDVYQSIVEYLFKSILYACDAVLATDVLHISCSKNLWIGSILEKNKIKEFEIPLPWGRR